MYRDVNSGFGSLQKYLTDWFEPEPALAQLPKTYNGENNRGVKYYSDPSKYKVTIEGGLLKRNGILLDSQTVYKYYKSKRARSALNSAGRQRATMGAAIVDLPIGDKTRWGQSLIWVLSAENRFYSHLPKISRVHHSSFTSGSAVRGAGMWVVEQGVLKELSALSGHYTPDMAQFITAVLKLKPAIMKGQTRLYLWEVGSRRWVSLPYHVWTQMGDRLFNNYKTHPNAVKQKITKVVAKSQYQSLLSF